MARGRRVPAYSPPPLFLFPEDPDPTEPGFFMKIIALDVSLTCTGVAIRNPLGLDMPESRQIRPRGKYAKPGPERLLYHDEELRKLLEDDGPPSLVVIEDYPHGIRGKGVRSLAELGGVVRLRLFRSGIPFVEVNPSKLKILARGTAKTTKEAVLIAAVRRLNYQGEDNNEADALWLLQFALQHYDLPGRADLPKSHTRALRGINWPAV